MAEIKPQVFERRVYEGARIDGAYSISAAKFSEFSKNAPYRKVIVETLSEYEAGCRLHRQCFGHMSQTPSGTVLPPQSMSMRVMEIATEYHAASKLAFAGDTNGYLTKLKETNYTKNGNMRCTMSTPVSGSCRLIATPQWEFGRSVVAISKNLASRMRVCRRLSTEEGFIEGSYAETSLSEGDWVIVVRPPSLHLGNTQPMKVRFWDNDCVGIHPESFSIFHGDFDGDEVHLYPVYDTGSVAECESWSVLPLGDFEKGRRLHSAIRTKLKEDEIESYDDSRARFIEHTTLSARQLKEGKHVLALGEYSRNKQSHISGMQNRFESGSTEKSFVLESIRGTGDVCRQQLSQGALGEMTRVAKIAASCFFRSPHGDLHVAMRNGTRPLVRDGIQDSGTPSVRAIANLCSVAQQAALDSHRAESHDVISHDFISDLILGCNRKNAASPTAQFTSVVFESSTSTNIVNSCKPKWRFETQDRIIVLCEPFSIPREAMRFVVGAYNPTVLAGVLRHGGNVTNTCKVGISAICNYYSIAMSAIELNDVAAVFSYKPDVSRHPTTTRDGMISRDLAQIETLLATDYTKLPVLRGDFETPNTSTASMFVANFNNMKSKSDSEQLVES